MSRTLKDRPFRVAERDLPPWGLEVFPHPLGGAYQGIRETYVKYRNRRRRKDVRQRLRSGQEVSARERDHRHDAKWDYW